MPGPAWGSRTPPTPEPGTAEGFKPAQRPVVTLQAGKLRPGAAGAGPAPRRARAPAPGRPRPGP